MSTHVLFLIVGLGVGAVYVALALGLVIVYRGTGVINFAQGGMAAWSAYVYDDVRRTGDLVLPIGRVHVGSAFPTAIAVAVASAVLVGLLAHLLIFRPLRGAPPLARVVASVGLMITMQATIVLRFSDDPRAIGAILPNEVVRWGSLTFSRDRLYLAGLAGLLTIVLWAYFRFTRGGLAVVASAENELGASLSGYSPDVLAGGTWVVSSVVTAVMVILAAPSTGLNPMNYTLFVVPALAVALVGRLQSLGVVCLAGLGLGCLQSEVTFLSGRAWWPNWATTGVSDALPLLVVVAILFVAGGRLPSRDSVLPEDLPDVRPPTSRPPVIAGLVFLGLAALAFTDGSYRFGVMTSMIMALTALSLVVLTGYVGQISLAQAAFGGSAGFALSRFAEGAQIPFPLAPLLAVLVATALGVLVGIPALRIRGAQLAVVTLAAAVTIQQVVFSNPSLSPVRGSLIPDATLFGLDLGVRKGADLTRLPFAVMVLVVLTLVAIAVMNIARGDTGRAFLAVRSNERAAAAAGINVATTKLLAFGVASFIAGTAGCLIGYSRGQLSPDSFSVFAGISILAFAYLGGITSVSGALVAGLFAPLGVVYVCLDRAIDLGDWYLLVSGISLIVTTIFNPSGIAGQLRATLNQIAGRRRPVGSSAVTSAMDTVGSSAT